MHRNIKSTLICLAVLALVAGAASAAISSSHTVTLDMTEVHDIAVVGGNLTLTMDSSVTAGELPPSETDATASLEYTVVESAGQSAKITVDMTVNNVPAGTSLDIGNDATGDEGTDAGDAANLTIAAGAVDFITGIGSYATEGSGPGLTYTWDFDTSTDLLGDDDQTVTITYTLVDGTT